MTRSLQWVGSAKRDLKRLPDEVQHDFGYALYLAQIGLTHPKAKALGGFASSGVMEVVDDWRGNAYRAVYTARFETAVFVLHVFQKKSKSGIATPRMEVDLIRARLRAAKARVKEWADENNKD